MNLSVIIPAKNEEKNIKKTVMEVYSYLSGKNIDYEIIVAENNSTDKTVEVVKSLMSGIPTLQLLELVVKTKKPSKGYAVKQGMLKAKGDLRLFMDADNSTTVDHIEKAMPYFDQGYSVVIGSIGLEEAKIAAGSEPFWRKLFGKAGNLFIQAVVLPGISDTQRGFKIFTAKATKDIFSKITMYGWAFDVEALALARKFGYKIKEIPINWNNDPHTVSHPRLLDYLRFLAETVKIRLNLWTGKY
ncbi:MAG: hypothetical protein A2655_02510 [Candidatus Yanofskybacteria bacterium RIFCSPHIGHO2_01_FULL_43_42]|uniref:dolichyl-phosphate beta-glucosyltransferase n=1 Tax=Candidatus Yanofskybacteria bacterium RIFCSPLOWO2_01_FULL_43_22 TaxID=1802695 RepID=A0A1F8GDJ5_9BACT|nr:MAG: hypothetical protein A2655_02510 [Candidatus Yanofskybacteria bacterium RIFCSPHIGHO2_01_FULL_43_42]OGN13401.1 MAG: hypothetical protein A3D48_00785 [Candidatus Yanofskybacteria bacterium RIFCSPHIGHO2_02_FULL_43_17]OGN23454.1 MAG: hypothetical protein A3A13_03525 [Candidatus Yanofskybacteria bacterium RIFCSPLOWO2_01_FULL_43_22]